MNFNGVTLWFVIRNPRIDVVYIMQGKEFSKQLSSAHLPESGLFSLVALSDTFHLTLALTPSSSPAALHCILSAFSYSTSLGFGPLNHFLLDVPIFPWILSSKVKHRKALLGSCSQSAGQAPLLHLGVVNVWVETLPVPEAWASIWQSQNFITPHPES